MITIINNDGSKAKELDCFTRQRNVGKYDPEKDPYRDYLRDEFTPDVWRELERARVRWGSIPISPNRLDEILSFQAESELKAIRHIKYKFLGECNYIEVYGIEAKKEYAQNSANKEIAYLHEKMDLVLKMLGAQTSENTNVIQLRRA